MFSFGYIYSLNVPKNLFVIYLTYILPVDLVAVLYQTCGELTPESGLPNKKHPSEFAGRYESKLLPEVKHSFDALVNEGKARGIDWSTIRYVGIELKVQPQHRFSPVPVTIVISSQGIEHRIRMERALVINGQWKVSQFVKLV